MANLAIKGHAIRGKEVIEILEMLGGKNKYLHLGEFESYFFFVQDGVIDCDEVKYADDYYRIYTLEEFLEKYPYKVEDKVTLDKWPCVVTNVEWSNSINEIRYIVRGIDFEKYSSANELQPYKGQKLIEELNYLNSKTNKAKKEIEENLNKAKEIIEEIIKIDIPKGYEFVGVDNQQVVFEKIKHQYPKSYEECCEYIGCDDKIKMSLIGQFTQLINARNAYWKIAGEQMGLGKPWKPDWTNSCEQKYVIVVRSNGIVCYDTHTDYQSLLAFPTEEMRDAFYENFKSLIEQCKDLL